MLVCGLCVCKCLYLQVINFLNFLKKGNVMKRIFFIFMFFSITSVCYAASEQTREDRVYSTNPYNDPSKGRVYHGTDPRTGDRITSVRPGRKNPESQNQQNMPIFITPEISPQNPARPPHPRPSGYLQQYETQRIV